MLFGVWVMLDSSRRPPLAWNGKLADSASGHGWYLLDQNGGKLSHTGANGSRPQDRIEAAGYLSDFPLADEVDIGH